MNFDYNLNCAHWGTNFEQLKPLNVHGCYGSMFQYFGENYDSDWDELIVDEAPQNVYSVYRIDTKEISFKVANWYLKKVVLPSVPKRMRKAVKVSRLYVRDTHPKTPLVDKRVRRWVKVIIDTNLATAEDIFILFLMVRSAQEQPLVVMRLYELAKKYPLNVALLAASANYYDGDHYLMGLYFWQTANVIPENIAKWNFKELWENFEFDGKPFSKRPEKHHGVNNHFMRNIMVSAEYNQSGYQSWCQGRAHIGVKGKDPSMYIIEEYNKVMSK